MELRRSALGSRRSAVGCIGQLRIETTRAGEVMKDFRQLEVWCTAQELALSVYRQTASFPREERYSLTDQIRRAAVSVPTNLAEGCGRDGDADFARFVQIAFGSACELESLLLLSRKLDFLKATDYETTQNQLLSVKRMLASLLKKLRAER